jgi:hypothetical protein
MGWVRTAQAMVSRESPLSRRKPGVKRTNSQKFTIAREPALVRLRMSAIANGPTFLRQAREPLFLLLLPPLAWIILNISLMNQASFLDPYIYTGYIHNGQDLLTRYGLTYYSVRFGLILPAKLFTLAFGTEPGYLAFRYVLTLLAGIPLYVLIKRHMGLYVAVLTYCALVTSPGFDRALFWDHPDASGVPYLVAAIALVALKLRPARVWDLIAGCLFGLALNSNFFTASIFGLFLVAYTGTALLYRRPILALARRLAYVLLGVVFVCFCGAIYYYHAIGLWNFSVPTISEARSLSHGGMRNWRIPGYAWVETSPHVLVLPLICIYSLIIAKSSRRSFLSTLILSYMAIVFAFYYAYQFAFDADILQLFYYFSYSIPAVLLSVALIFSLLWTDAPKHRLKWLAALGIAGLVLPWMLKAHGLNVFSHIHPWQFVLLCSITSVVLVFATYVPVPDSARSALVGSGTILIGLSLVFGFSTNIYQSVFQPDTVNYRREWAVYNLAMQFMDAVPKVKDTPGGLFFWYKSQGDLDSIQSTYLWGFSKSQQSPPADPGMPFIGPFQRQLFGNGQTKYLVLLGTSEGELQRGLNALTGAGFAFDRLDHRVLASGSAKIYWQLVEFSGR